MPPLNRREFLKVAGLLSLSAAAPRPLLELASAKAEPGRPNLLVIVFDALSAYNVPLYGYPRQTTPNLARLADRAIVYHNHFAGGNFTTPGTASLLTGTLPWTHRAFRYNSRVLESLEQNNLFNTFKDYYRVTYSHNPLVNTLLKQFSRDLDLYLPRERLFLANDGLIQNIFGQDEDIATTSWARTMKRNEVGYSYSLFLTHLYEKYQDLKIEKYKPLFPRGLPNIREDNYFILEQAVDWVASQAPGFPQPFLGYFHFLPPHFPYKTHRQFYEQLAKDKYRPVEKPEDAFNQKKSPATLLKWRTWYDEFILYVDREFGRLYDLLEQSGVLENTWVVFTSDHGELFERGISGHTTPVLNQPVIRVPLLIFEPGARQRVDVTAPTSAVDLLPTLLHLAGQDIPTWTEGALLPPFSPLPLDSARSLYALQAVSNEQLSPLSQASTMLVKGPHKLVYYSGYEKLGDSGQRIELYDLQADPEELVNLFPSRKALGSQLLDELQAKLAEVNVPYHSS
jgi:arylsulfatase A-like enzyme